ncbi:transmembrane protein 273 isoform X5 [Rousettus aegyptiacus]|uniref:transmembrane protein 273 isoform X5 n=1 Tax=Rousettus aegyptiacus TaxID=9407 RepID=UPI0007899846|nr:transmembrane protein 273 isoform X5 [Rousettus aegyptiacus]
MGSVASMLRALLFLLDVGGAQVLATEKSARAETDIKYAIIGTALGVAISAVFLALKYCMIKKHLFDNDSSDLRSTHLGFNDTTELKKRIPRLNLNYPERLCLALQGWLYTHLKRNHCPVREQFPS